MERVYLLRRKGGMGLIELNDTYRNTILNLDYYLKTIQDGRPPSKSEEPAPGRPA